MIKTAMWTQNLFECEDVAVAGGKAVNLGKLMRAGFPVPGGFVVTTRAYAAAREATGGEVPSEVPADVREAILTAYRNMGLGPVAVRSSATAEDMGNASMAGQYETFLDIEGEAELLAAVRKCWASLDVPRTRAYLQEHGIDIRTVSMAVVVQRLVPADVAGVLFTANPNDGAFHEMLVEASWGLGEMVVSGRVQPDILRLERETGKVIQATIADKQVHLRVGHREERPVEESRRRLPCLEGKDVEQLWKLGRKTAEHFGAPQDIEWAIHDGNVFLLQSRPITTAAEAEAYDAVLRSTRQKLKEQLKVGRGPWALHNLAETLVHPTPLTWSVIGRFMTGRGGFGAMYREAGFVPSDVVNQEGFLELIAGRVYMDLSRAAEMFFEDFPFTYDVEELKRSPDASQSPPSLPKGGVSVRMAARRKLLAVQEKLQGLSVEFDLELHETHFPEIEAYIEREKAVNLKTLGAAELVALWESREKQVMDVFGPELLLPSLIGGMALAELRAFLEEHSWEEDPDTLAQFISSGGLANRTVVADAELYEVAHGNRTLSRWLADHGHRAAGEFDLAAPRWRERPEKAGEMAGHLMKGEGGGPMERHGKRVEEVDKKVGELRAKIAIEGADVLREFDRRVNLVRRYVTFREDAKDFLMMGYELLREVALEAGWRLKIGEDVFFLTREELFAALRADAAPAELLDERKRVYRAEGRVSLPQVIDAAAVDTLGDVQETKHEGEGYKAFAISSGEAMGRAVILTSPTDSRDLGTGYILVCPSTDPSWTPLFVNAAGLVLECGGTLSHGAVVAREMGLPAVVLPGATKIFKEGEELHIDGRHGWVGLAAEHPPRTVDEAVDPENVYVPRKLVPPPVGTKDRRAAKARNLCAAAWTAFLLAFFLLPRETVHEPTLRLLDGVLWPIVRAVGRPGVVVVIAAAVAAVTLVLQRVLTDNRRLLEAKRRAAALKKEADALPEDSRRRRALMALVNPVMLRTLGAAMVPVGILLGPMVMPFIWMQERIDPSVQVGKVGEPVQVVAMVDGEHGEPVTVHVGAPASLDEMTPTARTLPVIRPVLERVLRELRQKAAAGAATTPGGAGGAVDALSEAAPGILAADLEAYLKAGIPARGVSWRVNVPEGFEGAVPVAVAAGGKEVTARVVVGDRVAPAPATIAGNGVVRELRVVYPRGEQKPFFQPLAFAGGKVGAWDIGWVWLYIGAYLPVLVVLRWLLKVA
jgi:pyruvate,water dikinase